MNSQCWSVKSQDFRSLVSFLILLSPDANTRPHHHDRLNYYHLVTPEGSVAGESWWVSFIDLMLCGPSFVPADNVSVILTLWAHKESPACLPPLSLFLLWTAVLKFIQEIAGQKTETLQNQGYTQPVVFDNTYLQMEMFSNVIVGRAQNMSFAQLNVFSTSS